VCALLNAQPMGFYHPSVLVEDAKRHGVRFLPVDVTRSRARCTIEKGAVRLGFNYMKALGPTARTVCEEATVAGATSLRDFWRHTLLPRRAMENLVLAGAFDAAEPDRPRRALLWELKQVEESLPPRTAARRAVDPSAAVTQRRPPRGRGALAGNRLGDEARAVRRLGADPLPPLLELPAAPPPLPEMDERTRVLTEYALSEVSTGRHLLSFIRSQLTSLRCRPLATIRDLADGSRVRVAGLVIARQAPSSASGFRFFTLADEDAHLDLIFRPAVIARTRRVANHHPLLMVEGRLQNERGRVNLVVETVTALDGDGVPIDEDDEPAAVAPPSHDYR
jgi:error-prone DNA polymerase